MKNEDKIKRDALKYLQAIGELGKEKPKKNVFQKLDQAIWDMKREIKLDFRRIYWKVVPKRLVVSWKGDAIYEQAPWFNGDHLYIMRDINKPLISSGGGDTYTYSWKKAYKLMKENEKAYQQRMAQINVLDSLEKLQK